MQIFKKSDSEEESENDKEDQNKGGNDETINLWKPVDHPIALQVQVPQPIAQGLSM